MTDFTIEIWSLIKVIVGAIVAAVITYFATRKKNKAEIANMEIGGFTELRKLVEELAKDVATLQREKKDVEKRLAIAEKAIEDERKTFKDMLSQKDEEVKKLTDKCGKLTDELKKEKDISTRQQKEIDELRCKLDGLEDLIKVRQNGHAMN